MMFDMTGVTRQYVDMEVDYDGVEYTGPDTLLEYTVSHIIKYRHLLFHFLRSGT